MSSLGGWVSGDDGSGSGGGSDYGEVLSHWRVAPGVTLFSNPMDRLRLARVLEGIRAAVCDHDASCGDPVRGVALSPAEHELLGLAEVWGIPVLAWDDVAAGQFRLLCDRHGVLIPQVDTVDELLERWTYHLD